jgi:hypothetical protein
VARDLTVQVRQFVVEALASTIAVSAIVGDRVFGPAEPDNPEWPFVRMDLPDVVPDNDGCSDGSRYGFNLHAFAKGPDERAVGQLAAALAAGVDELSGDMTVVPPAYVRDTFWNGTELRRDVDEVDGWHGVIRVSCFVSG